MIAQRGKFWELINVKGGKNTYAGQTDALLKVRLEDTGGKAGAETGGIEGVENGEELLTGVGTLPLLNVLTLLL